MASAEQILSIASGVVGAFSGITGSVVAVLSYRASSRPGPDRPGKRRWSRKSAPSRVWRWVALALAAVGVALATAVVISDLNPALAITFAAGLSIGSVAVVATFRRSSGSGARPVMSGDSMTGDSSFAVGLVVEREEAVLTLSRGAYHVRVSRWMQNHGAEPVTETPIAVTVDRFPDHGVRSRQFYRQNPLVLDEISLSATLDGRPLGWKVVTDHEAFKEIWLQFGDDEERFPLYPGEGAVLEYAYSIGVDKWGPFFQRSLQLPTRFIAVEVRLPKRLRPQVWGAIRNSAAQLDQPLEITCKSEGEFEVFQWQADNPQLYALMRMYWRLNGRDGIESTSGRKADGGTHTTDVDDRKSPPGQR